MVRNALRSALVKMYAPEIGVSPGSVFRHGPKLPEACTVPDGFGLVSTAWYWKSCPGTARVSTSSWTSYSRGSSRIRRRYAQRRFCLHFWTITAAGAEVPAIVSASVGFRRARIRLSASSQTSRMRRGCSHIALSSVSWKFPAEKAADLQPLAQNA